MEIIKTISNLIREELCDAEKYARLALHHKEKDADAARVFMDLSKEEMEHQEKLHNLVAKEINKASDAGKRPTTEMQWVYNYLHEEQIEKAEKVMDLQRMYSK